MGPIWGRQDPGGPHGGPINVAIWIDMFVDGVANRATFTFNLAKNSIIARLHS